MKLNKNDKLNRVRIELHYITNEGEEYLNSIECHPKCLSDFDLDIIKNNVGDTSN